jgi:KipI family sensor histidine kinase inhibitor
LNVEPSLLAQFALSGLVVQNYGDSAILLTAVIPDETERWRLVHRISDLIAETKLRGVLGAIATFDSVLVEFDCITTSHDFVVAELAAAQNLVKPVKTESLKTFSVPVVYGHEYGPDLGAVAAELGLSESAVVSGHADGSHVIRCVVSPPGSPMTDLTTFTQPIRRLPAPRAKIPAGSIAVAGRQATIYATTSPGGWRLIGRTPARLFDSTANPPVLYSPGDILHFFPIRPDAWSSYVGMPLRVVGG